MPPSLGRRLLRFFTHPSLFTYSITQRVEGFRDKLRGLDFSMVRKWDRKGNSNYASTAVQARRLIADYLKDRVTNNDAIIDIGCGKGRMLWFFS